MKPNTSILRRYTSLPAVIMMLRERKVALLSPEVWDDRNDSYYLRIYKQRKKLKTLTAACFTEASETYHHWRVFSHGTGGVCVSFRRRELLAALEQISGVRTGGVRYRTIGDLKRRRPQLAQLPFVKRVAFRGEEEFRAIYESAEEAVDVVSLPISLRSIERIIISPWMPLAMHEHVKIALRSIRGCSKLKVTRSTLIENEQWKAVADGAA